MSEYFRPSKIWRGKLCYVELRETDGQRKVMAACRITTVFAGGVRVEVVLVGGDSTVVFADILNIYDCIDGPTDFYDVPGGKP